ncbi:hypothetical protein EV663_1016 [Rhodovulum bhavnagarense]|uniref:Uncharacterized protein n=1 Tax=Rhodovulum bhavnagarense TaxID=992286 RepID=A0A4V2SWL7_9RHOB|nr:hypothetical protein [Rhodovulum bhavnagarense]TCP62746.1 hypothetical protein EV663_1016 [Rhodovulum bhavnagarense]
MRTFALILSLSLAACASPREICERDALREIRVLDALIVETRQTLERGYALRREPYSRPRLELCQGATIGEDQLGVNFCNTTQIAYRDRPVAVDLEAEARKLKSLKKKRKTAAREAARRLAACRRQYPEG